MAENNTPDPNICRLAQTHFRWGWLMLLGFLTLGIFLEALHG